MNKSAWKLDDPEWVMHQEKKWSYFKEEIAHAYDEESDYQDILNEFYDYITGKNIELVSNADRTWALTGVNWVYRILMHPAPTEDVIREVFADYIDKGYQDFFPDPRYNIQDISGYCRDLVADGSVDVAVIDAFMNVVYGNSIDQLLAIHRFEWERDGSLLLENLSQKVGGWFAFESVFDTSVVPIHRWVDLFLDALSRANDSQVMEASFRFDGLLNLLNNAEKSKRYGHIERSMKVVNELRRRLIGSKASYCDLAQSKIEELESKLIAEDKI